MAEPTKPKHPKDGSPVPRLDTLRDMDAIQTGNISGKHIGLHAIINIPHEQPLYGRITFITHQLFATVIEITWNGIQTKYRSDPEQVIRIEAHQ